MYAVNDENFALMGVSYEARGNIILSYMVFSSPSYSALFAGLYMLYEVSFGVYHKSMPPPHHLPPP